jgi:dimethylglycine dehydrogenase
MDGLWLATGFNVGIETGGGSAEILAQWMTTRQSPVNLEGIHADRFGFDMPRETAQARIKQVYARGCELPQEI